MSLSKLKGLQALKTALSSFLSGDLAGLMKKADALGMKPEQLHTPKATSEAIMNLAKSSMIADANVFEMVARVPFLEGKVMRAVVTITDDAPLIEGEVQQVITTEAQVKRLS